MKYPDYKFIATAFNGIKSKRRVIGLQELVLPSHPNDCFSSWCRYDQDYYDHWDTNNFSVKGFQGDCYTDFIPIDIDNSDLNHSLKTCRIFLKDLEHNYEVPMEPLRISFSGLKGFHIGIPAQLIKNLKPSADLPYRIKEMVRSFGYNDIDLRIYKINQLLRLRNSINSKSGLFKIQLTYSEIMHFDISKIRSLAEKPRDLQISLPVDEWDPVETLGYLWEESANRHKEAYNNNSNYFNFPGVEKGKRNETAFNISRQLFSKGHNIKIIKGYIVNTWNPLNTPPENDIRSLLRTVESAQEFMYYDSGYIAITKHFRNDPYFNSLKNDPKVVYVHIISHLNEIEKIVWGKYSCKPNQLIFSYQSLAEKTNTNPQVVRTLIKKLKEWGRIDVETLSNNGKVECSRLTFYPFSLKPFY